MNILFFITPKCDVAYLTDQDTLRNVLEKMEYHHYSAIPILSKEGKYIGTITEGDLLWEIKNHFGLNLREAEKVKLSELKMNKHYNPVDISSSMEDLLKKALSRSFVPVVDDYGYFIGIIRRHELVNYLYQYVNLAEKETKVPKETGGYRNILIRRKHRKDYKNSDSTHALKATHYLRIP